ncbi:MAG: hypothetical protein QOJ57_546 [Thermoleophilaceae bacterium]|nr:hypothetical protein [Thermoleophilaceae bacterium]
MPARESALVESTFAAAEGGIYLVVASLLLVAAVFTAVGTVVDVIEGSDSRSITDTGVFILSRVLLMFIIAELLYTLRLVNFGGRILVEPFLFIGLIACVRRILVITAEVEGHPQRRDIEDFLIQVGALAGLVIVLAAAIHLLRGSAGGQP